MLNSLKQLFTRAMSTTATATERLRALGYDFDAQGIMRQLDPATGKLTESKFYFHKSPDYPTNQKHYETLGGVIDDYVYELLDKHGMKRIQVPKDQPADMATFVFATKAELKNVDKLMILVHGSGVVRAGQWARSIIINDSLEAGTVLPYIKRAQALGYEVIVTNTNDVGRKGIDIPGCEKPEEHFKTVWKEIVQPAKAKSIALVGHSYGGWILCHVGEFFKDDYKNRVFAAALTDSVHLASGKGARMTEIGVNFVSSEKTVGTPIPSEHNPGVDMLRVSAGTKKHELTSHTSIDEVFKHFAKRYQEERGGEAQPEVADSKEAAGGAKAASPEKPSSDEDLPKLSSPDSKKQKVEL